MPRLLHAPLILSVALHVAVAAVIVRGNGTEAPAPAPLTPGLSGETFDVPETESNPDELDAVPAGAAGGGAPRPARTTLRVKAAGPGARAVRAEGGAGAGPGAGTGAEGGATSSAAFGAVGERGVVDLATAFTRAFPQAASGDAVWAHVPLGSAGSAEVVLEIDASGHLIRSNVTGSSSPALKAAVEKTLILVRARTFVASSAVTRLRLSARVSPDDVHDGLHGDVFALGASYMNHEGSAFFALAIGRRIDVTVTAR